MQVLKLFSSSMCNCFLTFIFFSSVVPIDEPTKGSELLANAKKMIEFAKKSPGEKKEILRPHHRS